MKPSYSRQEPHWAPWSRFRHYQVPAGVEPWLRDRGSLTAHLKRAAAGDFRVGLLRQGWTRPFDSERRLLAMYPGEIAVLREVELVCRGRPWVFARTLIPIRSLRGPARRLTMLGDRPLGEVLFADPSMRRGITQMARLQPRHALFASATVHLSGVEAVWGRRTLFQLAGKPLLVNEIFLPDIPMSVP